MIEKVTAINTNYSGLETFFPDKYELDTNSALVLVVGPNGSGKTAFLRMLATSLEYERFFRENGLSRLWQDYNADEAVKYINEAKVVESDWYYASWAKELIHKLAKDPKFNFDIQTECKYFDNKLGEYQHITAQASFICISKKGLDMLTNLKETLSKETDRNVWGYFKPQISGGHVYFQEVALHIDQEVQERERLQLIRYSYFDPTFDGNQKYVTFDGRKRHAHQSPGQSLSGKIDKAFKHILDFFEEGKNPVWDGLDYSLAGQAEYYFARMFRGPQYKHVPENSQLVVFMDEPSNLMDYNKKYEFRDKILNVLEKHSPILQIFIATNEPILIEKTFNCKYINLYRQPAQSTSQFLPPS